MTVCYLGIVNKLNELVRIHLAGRLAMNNEKVLKKNKCYYIRGFDLVSVKSAGVQIRLKDKEYKIAEIHNDDYIKMMPQNMFVWDHEHNDIENDFVDVIGVVEDVEEKATYGQNGPHSNSERRSVVRVVVKNRHKFVRISFWTDQLPTLESLNL